MPIIEVKNLSKSFGGNAVIKGLSFSVEEGEYLCVVGENGSGKTTLIRLLLGLISADSGEIICNGFKKSQIGYLPQADTIRSDFPANVREVVLSGTLGGRGFFSFYNKKARQTADKMMERLKIADIADKSYRNLSGGQRQRVLLARALCATKKVLILDEPITGLDPVATAEFYKITEELRHGGVTLIMISHDISCAVHYGSSILHMGENEYYYGSTDDYVKTPLGQKMLAGGHCHD